MLLFKNMPRVPVKLSPTKILFGQNLSDGIPATKANYLPKHQTAMAKRTSDVMNFMKQFRATTKRKKHSKLARVFSYKTATPSAGPRKLSSSAEARTSVSFGFAHYQVGRMEGILAF